MSWKLIATASPAGSTSCVFSNVPRGYKRLKILGAFSPSASSTLTFGSGNSSDTIFFNFNGINGGGSIASQRVPSGSVSGAGSFYCYFSDWDATNFATDISGIRIEIDNYDVSGANVRIPFHLFKTFPYQDNKYGTMEYGTGTNNNQSGAAFTNIHFTTGNTATFQTGSKFSLYGLE